MEKKLPVGIQVYGLRDLLENTPENFKSVMTKVKEMGYDGVELAGLYGLEPEFVKKTLDEVGLTPISAHVAFQEMMDDIDKVIADYSVIGVKYLVMPYMAEEYRPANPAGFKEFLPLLNEVGEKIHKAGMTFLYHNHDFEFVKLENGKWGYDEMFDAIPAENLQSELDTCWCDVATGEAPEFIKKYTDRIPVVHLKDYIKKGEVKNMYKLIGIDEEESAGDTGYFGFRPVGFGQMIWEPVLAAAMEANAQWVIVEQDEHYELEPLECARRSREYLRILGW
ncbi:Sugar phosphate isomerase/epimerase [Pseudobutyrivibrio sp. NOR37]|uniref:Sugar phosphate isomerase/epimerase n=1 Tax=Pseudobutyrivibrio xylanivorans TaxID=185007 RepID=A0A6M0LJ62_PSEXY|nr:MULTISPECIES: sugar phosphate isomerase/epimerase [Pseudobutyrivibrio]NEX02545.1 sugar phosphate isomerase/epimerase [Pseudobutyrivibrio xylanivorans]SFR82511.1 Sugar phosphate isomerase/epimerase [Pseudobutyrivibrio sp. NOR37]